MDEDEIGSPVTHADEVAANVERIADFFGEGTELFGFSYLSTSQKIMIGLALCRPDLLERANYPASNVKAAWARLDDAQREAIIAWSRI